MKTQVGIALSFLGFGLSILARSFVASYASLPTVNIYMLAYMASVICGAFGAAMAGYAFGTVQTSDEGFIFSITGKVILGVAMAGIGVLFGVFHDKIWDTDPVGSVFFWVTVVGGSMIAYRARFSLPWKEELQ